MYISFLWFGACLAPKYWTRVAITDKHGAVRAYYGHKSWARVRRPAHALVGGMEPTRSIK